jgi:NADH-quinone oxidoreductase subunit L
MMAGTLAITGVGIAGVFGFGGFYSKDAIIESALASRVDLGGFAAVTGLIVALMTSFYSWRLMFLTFWGKPRWAGSEHIQHAVHDAHGQGDALPHDTHGHGSEEANAPAQEYGDSHANHDMPDPHHGEGTGGYHPHESPLSMLVPLVVLSCAAVLAGFVFNNTFVSAESGVTFWKGSVAFSRHLAEAAEGLPAIYRWSPTLAMLIGLSIAWYGYIRNPGFPAAVAEQLGVFYRFVYNKWYFDELYDFLFVRPAFWLGRQFWKVGDIGIIDRFGPNGAAWVVEKGSVYAKKVQSGYLYSYALVMLLGLVGAISWVMVR